jgi:hypothetical protein
MSEEKLSFIPKKSFEKPLYKRSGPGLFLTFSFLLLLVSGLIYGGAILYSNNLKKQIDLLSKSLERAKAAFEFPLINELFNASQKIHSSKIILEKHITLVPVFDILESSILKDVRFNNFKYSLSKAQEQTVLMDGTAKNYSSLASQGEIFEKNKNIKNVSFSNLGLGDKGTINFTVTLILDPIITAYKAE